MTVVTAYLQHQRFLVDMLSFTSSESTLCEVKFPKLSVLNVLEKVSSFFSVERGLARGDLTISTVAVTI